MNQSLQFQQIHIDVARNATDDFNPFHDKHRWQNIADNPFGAPIVLGFQLECLIEESMRRYRMQHGENDLIQREGLHYSQYEFKFANAVSAGQRIAVDVRKSRFKPGDTPSLANRVSLLADGKLAMTGYKRELKCPPVAPALDLPALGDLGVAADRTFLADGLHFLKRKYMTTSNAKNFLSGSLVEQSEFIDEIADKVQFPEMFPCSLLSCALLERASQQGHDFEQEPMVYKSHSMCIDRACLQSLRSNDVLHLLSRHADPEAGSQVYDCFGVIASDRVLFSARIELMPLGK